ncbi:MAG: hypothetical protein QXQ82_02485 [Candidatus Pacearchaeota archaeon]
MINKKAFFFTLTILFLITLLLLISFSYRKEYTRESIKTRLLVGNSLVEAIEKDAERAIYISGRRTIIALLDYVVTRGYIDESKNFDDIFKEAFLNGTLNTTLQYAGADAVLENTTFEDWKNATIARVQNFKFDITFYGEPEISINQSTPWAIDMNLNISYKLEDKEIRAVWIRNLTLVGKIPILGLEDPLYVREFGKNVANVIHKTNVSVFVTGDCDISNLSYHLDPGLNQTGSLYINNSQAPNFLSRLKGNASAKDFAGIESIIHREKLENLDIEISNTTSLVDHSYFENATNNLTGVVGIPWLLMTCQEASEIYRIPADCTTSSEC